jgi:hypothetical protein
VPTAPGRSGGSGARVVGGAAARRGSAVRVVSRFELVRAAPPRALPVERARSPELVACCLADTLGRALAAEPARLLAAEPVRGDPERGLAGLAGADPGSVRVSVRDLISVSVGGSPDGFGPVESGIDRLGLRRWGRWCGRPPSTPDG